jgi:hypothetical protein
MNKRTGSKTDDVAPRWHYRAIRDIEGQIQEIAAWRASKGLPFMFRVSVQINHGRGKSYVAWPGETQVLRTPTVAGARAVVGALRVFYQAIERRGVEAVVKSLTVCLAGPMTKFGC